MSEKRPGPTKGIRRKTRITAAFLDARGETRSIARRLWGGKGMRTGLFVLTGMGILLAPSAWAHGPSDSTLVSNEVFQGELTLWFGGGRLDYREEISLDPVESDFEAAYGEVGARYAYAGRSGLKLRLGVDAWATDNDTERWRRNGEPVQRNRLDVSGVELRGECGLDILRRRPEELNVWLGLGYRAQRFERDQFRFLNREAAVLDELGTVQEDYALGLFRIGLDAGVHVGPKWMVRGAVGVGLIFFSEAENELLGRTIDGDGGVTVEAGVDVSYAVADRHTVGVGFRYDFQELDGDTERGLFQIDGNLLQAAVEWPDNELEHYAFDMFWRVQL